MFNYTQYDRSSASLRALHREWENAGCGGGGTAPKPSSKVAPAKALISTPPLPKAAAPKRPVHHQEASSRPVITLDDCVLDDPDKDMSLFTDPFCDDDEGVTFASPPPKSPPKVMKSGSSTAYDKDGLWAALQASR
jgi:hypothetical protein